VVKVRSAPTARHRVVELLLLGKAVEPFRSFMDALDKVEPVLSLRALLVCALSFSLPFPLFNSLAIPAFARHTETAILCSGVRVDELTASGARQTM
jgi:hypothetical protein